MRAAYIHFSTVAPGSPMPAPLASHLRGEPGARPVEALKRRDLPRAIDLGSQPERAALLVARALAERAAAKTGGRPPAQNVKLLATGPPPWESADAWPRDRVAAWCDATVAWVLRLLPKGVPLSIASLHCDETSPHLHLAFPPALPDAKGITALSWKRCLAHMAAAAAGARVPNNPAARMRALQDSYHEQVGKHFGLARGAVGENRQYAPLDRTKGIVQRLADTDARLQEERQARREADERAESAAADARLQTDSMLEQSREFVAVYERRANDLDKKRKEDRRGRLQAERYADVEYERRFRVDRRADEADRRAAVAQDLADREGQARVVADNRAATAEILAESDPKGRVQAERRAGAAETLAKSERQARVDAERRAGAAETRAERMQADRSRAVNRLRAAARTDTARSRQTPLPGRQPPGRRGRQGPDRTDTPDIRPRGPAR